MAPGDEPSAGPARRRRRPLLVAGLCSLALVVAGPAGGRLAERRWAEPAGAAGLADAATVAAVRLGVADQQGLALANQAAAQSASPAVRAAAAHLAAAYAARLDAVDRLLDGAGVGTAERLAVPVERIGPPRADSVALTCDLLADDDVSRLAAAPADGFDGLYADLARRHAAGGVLLADELVARAAVRASDATAVLRATRDVVRRAAVLPGPA